MGRHLKCLTRVPPHFNSHVISVGTGHSEPKVRIRMRKHQARGLMSLLQDLPDLGQRLGTLTPCLLILGVCPSHYTGSHPAAADFQQRRTTNCEIMK